ncbi:outer dense fiber protein 3-like [Argiope bruennichi]|uniref:outer dense fiber protein 3-like n=1 Tax=Argiope bruennichi TaxID=94029 RepID=UPI002494ACE3|nr:outer dense fiber protein 3-like [Argiope bruennichi]
MVEKKDDDEHDKTEAENGENIDDKSHTDKHQHGEEYIKPGNKDYLSYYVYQGEWRPTKPKREVAATNKGPGPAIVNLPTAIGDQDHDPRRIRAPAYKIGERDMRHFYSCAPGSAKYDTRTLTNKGKDVCHAPKIGEKIKGMKPFESPGPAKYHRGDSDGIVFSRAPAYTMQFFHDFARPFNSPAPDRYTLPECMGSRKAPYGGGPQYVIGERLDKTGIPQLNPGPAAYQLPSTNVTKQKPPAYTMGLKTLSQRIGTATPGPASNDLHMVKFHKPATPRFTFGIRHSPYKAFQAFAPGD